MIPKTIHYCWFGENEISEKEKECIDSWKRVMPDYEIKKWDESNYDYKKNSFIKDAYESKKWAFVSDFARLDIIYNNGGIYLDTDVEVIKRFDELLLNKAFFGFENSNYVSNGLGFGAEQNNSIIKENLDFYKKLEFNINNLNSISCSQITTNVLKDHGLVLNNKYQELDYATIYPKDYFCPIDYYTGKTSITNNTFSIHHFFMSWFDKRDKKWFEFNRKLTKIFPSRIACIITTILKLPGSFIIRTKNNGIIKSFKYYINKIRSSKREKRKT